MSFFQYIPLDREGSTGPIESVEYVIEEAAADSERLPETTDASGLIRVD